MAALTSVSPDNPSQDKTAQAQDDSLMRQPPQTPVPGANPMNTSELGANQISKATLQGDQSIASAAASGGGGKGGKSTGSSIGGALGSIGGTIVGGPIGGAVGGFLGDIFGGLFSEGGPVGYAQGGAASNPSNSALAAGYLVGALHQAKFGGTPETLHEAANTIKGMLGGEGKGMAQGGPANPDDTGGSGNLANEELMKALGMQQPAPQVQQPQAQGANTPTQPQQQMPLGTQNNMAGGDPNAQRGYAAGGIPGMPPQAQPMGAMPSLPMKSQEHMPYNAQQASQGAMGAPQGMPQSQPMGAPQGMPQQSSQGLMQQPPGYAAGGPPQEASQGMPQGQGFEGDGKVEGPGGPTDDAIPAKLSNGEFVMSSAATQFWGVDKLAKMNDQGKQGFMQKIQQVDAQQQGPNGQPVQAPQADPMSAQGMPGLMQPPMKAAKGGAAVMRTKGSGYCGM